MTKFVAGYTLYLKNPSDEQLDAVIGWMADKNLDMQTCREATAVFTKTGTGKASPAIAIEFSSEDSTAQAQMAQAYPAPKSLANILITDHDATDPVSDMPIAPINDPVQAPAPGSVSIAEVMEGTPGLTPGDRALAQARQAINVGGPMPSVVAANSADDVPF
jgi:hypothetical protein